MALSHQKAAARYEVKRICEAERKRKERKERANGSTSGVYLLFLQPTVLSKHWLKQPPMNTHSRMNTYYSGSKMVFLNSERRTLIWELVLYLLVKITYSVATTINKMLSIKAKQYQNYQGHGSQ